MYHKKGLYGSRHLDFVLLDVLCLIAAVVASYAILRPQGSGTFSSSQYQGLLLSLVLADLAVIGMFGTMEHVRKRGYLAELLYTLRNTAMVAAIVSMFLFGLKMGAYYSRLTFFTAMTLYGALSYLTRITYKIIYRRHIAPRIDSSMLIITNMDSLEALARHIEKQSFDGYTLVGLVITDLPAGKAIDAPLPVVTDIAGAADWVRQNWVDEIMLILPPDRQTTRYANTFVRMGITVHVGIEQIRGLVHNRRQEIEVVGGFHVVTAYWRSATMLQSVLKRTMDIAGGIAGCLVTLVLTLILGPAIYLASPGPIFYTQERIGRNGKVFKMYKFRSMYLDADARKQEFMDQNRVSGGLMFKLDWDPRIIGNRELPDGTRKTGIGEFIRKTSLDEFPQFFNVLKGDMSLVGTRPPTKDEWLLYEDHHRARMAMRPGITGMWQVSGRSNITDFEEVVRLDTKYIDEWSLKLDIKILLKTVCVVFRHEGSM